MLLNILMTRKAITEKTLNLTPDNKVGNISGFQPMLLHRIAGGAWHQLW